MNSLLFYWCPGYWLQTCYVADVLQTCYVAGVLQTCYVAGTAEQKAQMMFNIYDIRRRGYLTREDFFKMIR